MRYPTLLTLVGHLTMSAAYMLIGPAPFLEGYVSNSVNLSLGVAAMIGISWSLVGVTSFTRASRKAARLGYCDDMNTNLNLAGEFVQNRTENVPSCNILFIYILSSVAGLLPPGKLPWPNNIWLCDRSNRFQEHRGDLHGHFTCHVCSKPCRTSCVDDEYNA